MSNTEQKFGRIRNLIKVLNSKFERICCIGFNFMPDRTIGQPANYKPGSSGVDPREVRLYVAFQICISVGSLRGAIAINMKVRGFGLKKSVFRANSRQWTFPLYTNICCLSQLCMQVSHFPSYKDNISKLFVYIHQYSKTEL